LARLGTIGIEPEFMLLGRRPDGSVAPFDGTDTLDNPCYDYKGLAGASEFPDKLVTSLQIAGLDIYQIDREDANGESHGIDIAGQERWRCGPDDRGDACRP